MRKWEYKVIYNEFPSQRAEDDLNKLGAEGWEFVAINIAGLSNRGRFTFKREKQNLKK